MVILKTLKYVFRVKFSIVFSDFWVGIYFNQAMRSVYICLLPCLYVKVWRELNIKY